MKSSYFLSVFLFLSILINATTFTTTLTPNNELSTKTSTKRIQPYPVEYSSGYSFFVGYEIPSGISDRYIHRAYLEFDLSDIPNYAIFTNATLSLNGVNRIDSKNDNVISSLNLKKVDLPQLYSLGIEDSWNTLNSTTSGSTLSSFKASVFNTTQVSSTALTQELNSKLPYDIVSFGIVNQNETSDGLQIGDISILLTYTVEVPTAPVIASITNISSNSCTLNFSESSGRATSYKIYKDNVYLTTTNNTSYTITGLNSATSYSFKISALNEAGEGVKSLQADCLTKPLPPINVNAGYSYGMDRIISSWNLSTGVISGYRVYIKHNTYGIYLVGNCTPSTTYYMFSGSFESGWSVYLASFNNSGESDLIKANTSLVVQNFTYKDLGSGAPIQLSWNNNNSTKVYQIIRCYPTPYTTLASLSGSTTTYNIPKSSFGTGVYVFGIVAINPICASTITTTLINTSQLLRIKRYWGDNAESEINTENDNFVLYPNPVIEQLVIVGNSDNKRVTITNLNGQVVKIIENVVNNIDLSDLISGTYIVNIKYGSEIITQKIVKK